MLGGLQIGLNYSDKTNLVSIDAEKGELKFGYDFQREVRAVCGPFIPGGSNSLLGAT